MRDFVFDEDFIGFCGHFPGYPILPAVVQVMTAQLVAEEEGGERLSPASVSRAKFLIQLRPGEKIEVTVRDRKVGGRALKEGRLETGQGLAASFCMAFAQESGT